MDEILAILNDLITQLENSIKEDTIIEINDNTETIDTTLEQTAQLSELADFNTRLSSLEEMVGTIQSYFKMLEEKATDNEEDKDSYDELIRRVATQL